MQKHIATAENLTKEKDNLAAQLATTAAQAATAQVDWAELEHQLVRQAQIAKAAEEAALQRIKVRNHRLQN